MKDPRDDPTRYTLQPRRFGPLALQNVSKLFSEGEDAPFAVLCLARLQAYESGITVNLVPLQGQDFAR